MNTINSQKKLKVLELRHKLVTEKLGFLKESLHESIKEGPGDDFAATLGQDISTKNDSKKSSKSGFLSRLGTKLRQGVGISKPSVDMDDPAFAQKLINKSINNSTKLSKDFQQKALNTTKDINRYHNSVVDTLDKFDAVAQTLPGNLRGKYERYVIGIVKNFYNLLKNEKGRIEAYIKTLQSDLQSHGYNPSIVKSESKKKVSEDLEPPESDIIMPPKKSTSWGLIPSSEQLWKLMEEEPFPMILKGQDDIAYGYALGAAGMMPESGRVIIEGGEEMEDILKALINAPEPDSLNFHELENIEIASSLDEWDEKYPDDDIVEAAQNLASNIMEVLGIDWI